MKSFIISIQSFSDIITNSSSECFVCNDFSIKTIVEELFKEYEEKGQWHYGGEVCGAQVFTVPEYFFDCWMEDGYDEETNSYVQLDFGILYDNNEIDFISKTWPTLIRWEDRTAKLYREDLTEDMIFKIISHEFGMGFLPTDIIIKVDHGNIKFINDLKDLGFSLTDCN